MAYENWQVWIDFNGMVNVTADVETINSPILATDGQNSETADQAGSLTIVLRDIDGRYTPGNTQGVHYPYVTSGRRVEVFEVIGTERFDIFTGRLEWPEVDSWVQTSTSAPREQTITLTAVDLPTQLDNAETFIGTLAEHIRFHGGTVLVGYWPMNDAALPLLPVTDDYLPIESTAANLVWGDPTAQSGQAKITPASEDGPPGDDGSYPLYEMRVDTVSGFQRPARFMVSSVTFPTGSMTVTAGQCLTIVFWVNRSSVFIDAETLILLVRYFATPTDGVMAVLVQDTDFTWLTDITGATTASFVGPVCPSDRWTAVALRYGFSPNTVELWTDSVQTVGTLSFTPGSDVRIDDIYLPEGRFAGSIAHLQVYIGDAEDFTFADFTAQRRVGLEGLDRQLTGERIRTILGYAGITAGEMGEIDDGTTVMQPARLAGTTPGDQVRLAVDTERGDFHANGRGKPVFLDRRTLYNT